MTNLSGIRRGQLTSFVRRHALAWELSMGALTLAYVALALLVDEGVDTVATSILVILAAVFLAEFALRFWDAPSRLKYVRGHWIDLLTCMPPIGPLRVLRLVRLLGLFRLAQEIRDVGNAAAARRDRSARRDPAPGCRPHAPRVLLHPAMRDRGCARAALPLLR